MGTIKKEIIIDEEDICHLKECLEKTKGSWEPFVDLWSLTIMSIIDRWNKESNLSMHVESTACNPVETMDNKEIIEKLHVIYREDVEKLSKNSFHILRNIEEGIKKRSEMCEANLGGK